MGVAQGTKFGPYIIERLLGAGGMGEVYRARDTRLNRTVALKIIHERFSDRFQREATAIASLNHPHICTLYDVGPDFLVMEYIEGKPVVYPLPRSTAITCAAQILDALEAAHRRGIIHRDLKPANILLTASGAKLVDFGLAKSRRHDGPPEQTVSVAITAEQTIVGTPQYMAPEQIEGKPVDARTDIFAFGCVLHGLLTGRPAFEGSTPQSVMAAVLSCDTRSFDELRISTPGPLQDIVLTCLKRDPDARWQTAHDVRIAL